MPDRGEQQRSRGIETALVVQTSASSKGFDWVHSYDIIDKIREELDEVDAVVRDNAVELLEEEIGDLLFTVINLARSVNVDPERALERATGKFERRLGEALVSIERSGRTPEKMSLEELDVFWEATKAAEVSGQAKDDDGKG